MIREFRAALTKALNKQVKVQTNDFSVFSSSIPEVPRIIEKKNVDFVFYGEDNLYPYQLFDLPFGSAIHNSILKTKSKMTYGDGLLLNNSKTLEESNNVYNSLQGNIKADFDQLYKNPNGKEGLLRIIEKLSYDFQIYGAFCYEVVYNIDFSKIVTLKYVSVKDVRAGKAENDEIEYYYYSKDWTQWKRPGYQPTKIKAFDTDDKEHYNQLVYEKVGNLDYYGVPSYVGAITWIYTDFQMGLFHKSNLENGMNPSMALKFYKLPASENDRDMIMENIKRQFTGSKNTGKHMVFFSDGKELAPDIQAVETSGLDKQLIILAELCDKKILTGHQLTTPLLAGVSISGQLGGNTELETGFQIFDKVTMEADRNFLISSIQKIFDYNKVGVKIDINPFTPFKTQANG